MCYTSEVDKSFEGLLFSIIVHVILVVILWNAKSPSPPVRDLTEVTFVERTPTDKKSKAFVTETHPKDLAQSLKDDADFLSQFTKRVKRQMRAIHFGPTVNSMPKASAKADQQKVAGMQQQEPGDTLGTPGNAGSQAMVTVAIGPSTIAEHIPGIEQGAFTALNTNQFTYYAFFNRMHEQVRNRWIGLVRNYVHSRAPQELEVLAKHDRTTVVEIILGPGGQFIKGILHTSSGDSGLDGLHGQAFRVAAPFPNPPQGMFEPDGFIHLKYTFFVRFRPPSFGPASN